MNSEKLIKPTGPGKYDEINHCCLYLTGNQQAENWKEKPVAMDFYYLKGLCLAICNLAGTSGQIFLSDHHKIVGRVEIRRDEKNILSAGEVDSSVLRKFDIRQPVFFADIYWDNLMDLALENSIIFRELPRQIPVNRDLALIVEKSLPFEKVEKAVNGLGLEKLRRSAIIRYF